VSNLNEKVYAPIEAWRNRPIEGKFPYVYLDGIVLKRCWAEEIRNVSVRVAIGVNEEGYRQVLGIAEGAKEDKSGWSQFLKHLKERGLQEAQLFISAACMGLIDSLGEFYPEAQWQRCVVHFYRNIVSYVPKGKMQDVARMLKTVHAQEDAHTVIEKAKQVGEKLRAMKLAKAAEHLDTYVLQTFTFYQLPHTHWRQIKTNNPLERLMREIRRRTRVAGAFPDGNSALYYLPQDLGIAGTRWRIKQCLNMDKFNNKNLYQEIGVA
jgi:putative transposase